MELCVVNTTELRVYCFTTPENMMKDLERANQTRLESIKTWESHCKKYPDREDLKAYLEKDIASSYEIMTYNAFEEMERDRLLGGELEEITEENFFDALNVLPPIKWCVIDGVEMFCMSEMWSGYYTSQYARQGDKYYTKMVDCQDKSTWINNLLAK